MKEGKSVKASNTARHQRRKERRRMGRGRTTYLAASYTGRKRIFRDGNLLIHHVIRKVIRSAKPKSQFRTISYPPKITAGEGRGRGRQEGRENVPMGHCTDEDDDRMRVWDSGKILG